MGKKAYRTVRRCRGLWEGKGFSAEETERLEEGWARVSFVCLFNSMDKKSVRSEKHIGIWKTLSPGNAESPEKE